MSRRSLTLTALLLGLSQLVAAQESSYNIPLEWQKVELQKQIEDSLNRALSSVVERGKFVVQVDVRIDRGRGGAPSPNPQDPKGQSGSPLSKLGVNRDSEAFRRAMSGFSDSVFSRLTAIDVSLALDNSVPPPAERQAREFVATVVRSFHDGRVDLRVRRMAFLSNPTVSPDNESAKASLEAAKTLAEAIAQSNGKIAEAINLVQGRTPATNSPANDAATPAAAAASSFPKTWQEVLLQFQIPIGIVLATLLILFALRGFKRLESQKVALMAQGQQQAQNEAAAATTPRAEAPAPSIAGNMTDASPSSKRESAFDQFRRIAENSTETASYLLKLWINEDTLASREALAALTKSVPVESLVPIVASLDDEMRGRFKSASLTPVDAGTIARAEAYIVQQMVESFLVSDVQLPSELKVLLSGMSLPEITACMRKDSQLGGIFVNVFQGSQVARILKNLSESETEAILQDGLKFNQDSINYLEQVLEGHLSQIRLESRKPKTPLVSKSIELLTYLGPARENQVFQMLLSSGDPTLLVEASQRFYPAEIIMTFPPERLRILINRLPPQQRAALIYSSIDKDRKILLAAIGEQGRVREVINDELREIERNETLKAQIKSDRQRIWAEFVMTAREAIRSDNRLREFAEDARRKWLAAKGVDLQTLGGSQAA